MRCEYCKVEIGCKSKICPLCHEKLRLDPSVDLPARVEELPSAYPQKKHDKIPVAKKLRSFSSIYLSVALAVFIIAVAINLRLTPEIYWFAFVAAVLVYGYILIKHTILSNNSVGIKIFWQAVSILVLLLALNYLVKNQTADYDKTWVWDFGLPAILIVSTLVVGIYTSIAFHKWHSVIIDALMISALGFIPLILFGAGVVKQPVTSIASACLSSVAIIFCSILGRKNLLSEFKKKFHV
ncbi:MAG: hypothetical protein K2G37_05035 [Clostridia bacterium]|nr:hypothetical protein [Clostridia bacterium]MDE7328584.1 hypothetical protein [Clostridia bacterium]